jgi:hypothetical protein
MTRPNIALPGRRLLLTLCCLLTASLAEAQPRTGTACFADAAVDPVASVLLPIVARTDELIAIELQDGASATSVYMLTRQMVLTERILRRLLGRGDDCQAISDSIGREYAMLKRGYDAFANGDPELAIEAVASRRSQAQLQEIRAALAQTDAAVLMLVRRP